jgi:hypothetical protein
MLIDTKSENASVFIKQPSPIYFAPRPRPRGRLDFTVTTLGFRPPVREYITSWTSSTSTLGIAFSIIHFTPIDHRNKKTPARHEPEFL